MNDKEGKAHLGRELMGGKEGRYANVFQIGHNAFEFLIEFGQQDGGIHTRIYVSPLHARILSDLLIKAVLQHEKAFGKMRRLPEQNDT